MMDTKNNIFSVHGKVQHYRWGGFSYIPQLLGVDNKKQEPFAEYWLGAHINGPAVLENGETLDKYLSKHPEALGKDVLKRFGGLPYLLKILDVKDMLSIQVHPSKKSAEIEYAGENAKGTPLQAPHRNYKDDNHKPELMYALGEFWLLHGFSIPAKLLQTMERVPEFAFMIPVFRKEGYKGLYELLMTMDQQQVNNILQPVLDRIVPLYHGNKLQKNNPDFWAARASLTYNTPGIIDRGIFSIYLFNILHLQKGDAIFQDAGVLHAYLEGQNVEIMANSDNVLRGGLTPKHVDVPELMKHVVFEPVEPNIIRGIPAGAAETKFPTPAPDFELSCIRLAKDQAYTIKTGTTDILFVLSGEITVTSGGKTLQLSRGGGFVAFAGAEINLSAASTAEVYRASVPFQS